MLVVLADTSTSIIVSVQTISQAVNGLVTGLGQVKDEIKELQEIDLPADDQFIHVMQVSPPTTFLLPLSVTILLASPFSLLLRKLVLVLTH